MITSKSTYLTLALFSIVTISGLAHANCNDKHAHDAQQLTKQEVKRLQQALFERDSDLVSRLLMQKNIADLAFESGSTPLHTLAEKPILEPGLKTLPATISALAPLTQALLDAGVNPNQLNGLALTPLMVLAISGANTEDRLEQAKILIEGGASIDLTDDVGNTALIYAIQSGSLQLATLLLRLGANKTIQNGRNETALDIAKRKEYASIVELLAQ
jgi:ankyrin repeat protein